MGWKPFLSSFFSLQSGKLIFSFFPHCFFHPAEVEAQPHSTGLVFRGCLGATWGQANTLHVAVAWVSKGEGTRVNHKVASQGHCTAFVDKAAGSGKVRLRQKLRNILVENLAHPQPPLSVPHVPLAPVSCLFAWLFPRKAEKIRKPHVPVGF